MIMKTKKSNQEIFEKLENSSEAGNRSEQL